MMYDIHITGDYFYMTGYSGFNDDELPVVYLTNAYYDNIEENEEHPFLVCYTKYGDLIWSTYLGDYATSRGTAITSLFQSLGGRRELYVVGNVSFNLFGSSYLPLCDVGGDSYLRPDHFGFSTIGADGFINGFDISIIQDLPVGIDADVQTTSEYTLVFPNPTDRVLCFESRNMITYFGYNLCSINGNVLSYGTINESLTCIDIENIPAGMYVLRLLGFEIIDSFTFIVE